MKALLALVFVVIGAIAWGASSATFLIRDADVYPVVGAMMPATSVLIEDGKIADIGANIAAPQGAKIIEAKGLRVYPGMIDSCTQIGLSEIAGERATVDTNELGEFMPQLRALSAINPASEHIPVSRVNGITAVMSFPSSDNGERAGGSTQVIAGQAALIHLDGWTWEEMAIKGDAALQLIFPEMPEVAARDGENPPSRRRAPETVEEARRQYENEIASLDRFFDSARQYEKERAANAPGFKRDLKMEAMIPVLETKVRVAVFADRERSIRDAIDFARRQHIDIAIMQPRELRKVLPELRLRNIPVIFGKTEELPQNDDSPYDEAESLPAEAAKAGVKFAFSTGDNEFVRDLPYNAARAVAYGLPYDEALKALTISPAQIWGVADRIGSIEKGKVADLIVTNGDPLETPTQIKYLFIKGKQIDLSTRQTRLYQEYLHRP